MKITHALLAEHALLYRLLDHCAEGTDWSLERTQGAGNALAAALLAHASIEDELLFSALDRHLPPMGPLAVMRQEHEEIEGGLAQLPQATDAETARRLLRHVAGVARDHFAKEEQVLFHMAEQVLSAEDLERLGREWAGRTALVHS